MSNIRTYIYLPGLLIPVISLLPAGCDKNEALKPVGEQNAGADSLQKAERVDDNVFFYICENDFLFRVLMEGEQASVFLPDTTLRLPHVVSASGAKFGEGDFTYWSKGDAARLELKDVTYQACRTHSPREIWANHAREAFRTSGQEPGWILTVHPDSQITYLANYGENEYTFSTPSPVVDTAAATTTYRVETEAHELEVVLTAKQCFDAMSGWPFPTSVRLTFDGQTYRGCGRPIL